MFEVMENMPDSDLGSPGPLVHALEQMSGQYESELVESLKRRPTALAVWMVNRILNATDTSRQREFYLDVLRSVAGHPDASRTVREDALGYIEYQGGAA